MAVIIGGPKHSLLDPNGHAYGPLLSPVPPSNLPSVPVINYNVIFAKRLLRNVE